MPATITSEFRKNNAKNLIAQTAIWMGIGKSDPWPSNDQTIDQPTSSLGYSTNVLNNLIALVKAVGSLAVPNNAWASGYFYKVYSASDDSVFITSSISGTYYYPCYVTNDGKMYICTARTSATASSNAPTHSSGSQTGGVYTWLFLYDLSGIGYDTPNFIVVPNLNTTAIAMLPCWFVIFLAKFGSYDAVSNADIYDKNDYRQISLVDSPTRTANDSTNTVMDCLKYLTLNSAATQSLIDASTIDTIIEQCDSSGNTIISGTPAKAYLNHYIGQNVYYHQNDTSSVNMSDFSSAGYFRITGTTIAIQYTSKSDSEYVHATGKVLFIENRSAITRTVNQSEEIKLIVQL